MSFQVCQPPHTSMCSAPQCCIPRPCGKFTVALLYEQDCLNYYQPVVNSLCHVPSREVKSDTESFTPLSRWPGQCLVHPEASQRVTRSHLIKAKGASVPQGRQRYLRSFGTRVKDQKLGLFSKRGFKILCQQPGQRPTHNCFFLCNTVMAPK